jgi:hypothetical protein
MWDYDQQFKILLDRLTFQIQDVQHREWFIAGLLPHIHISLTQQKVTTQVEAMEIVMHLEAMPGGGETSVGMAQVQSHLTNLTMQLQDMAKAKVVHRMCGVLCVTQKVTIGMSVLH